MVSFMATWVVRVIRATCVVRDIHNIRNICDIRSEVFRRIYVFKGPSSIKFQEPIDPQLVNPSPGPGYSKEFVRRRCDVPQDNWEDTALPL